MEPVSSVALVIGLVQEAIKLEPKIADELAKLFANGVPTPADWLVYRTKNAADSFDVLAPDAAANLPPVVSDATIVAAANVAAAVSQVPTPAPTVPDPALVKQPGASKPPVVDPPAPRELTPPPVPGFTPPSPPALHPIFGTPIAPAASVVSGA